MKKNKHPQQKKNGPENLHTPPPDIKGSEPNSNEQTTNQDAQDTEYPPNPRVHWRLRALKRAFLKPEITIPSAGVIAVLLYTSVAVWQACEMGRAVDTSQKQLDAIDRPWIQATVATEQGGVTFDPRLSTISFQLIVSNIGRSIARNIQLSSWTIPYRGDGTDVSLADRRADECSFVEGVSGGTFNDLLPGEHLTVIMVSPIMTQRHNASLKDLFSFNFKSLRGTRFQLITMGCVGYRTAVLPIPHHTWFLYDVSRKGGPIELGKNLSAAELGLNKEPWFNGAD